MPARRHPLEVTVRDTGRSGDAPDARAPRSLRREVEIAPVRVLLVELCPETGLTVRL